MNKHLKSFVFDDKIWFPKPATNNFHRVFSLFSFHWTKSWKSDLMSSIKKSKSVPIFLFEKFADKSESWERESNIENRIDWSIFENLKKNNGYLYHFFCEVRFARSYHFMMNGNDKQILWNGIDSVVHMERSKISFDWLLGLFSMLTT